MTNLTTAMNSTYSLDCSDIDSFLPALKITHIFQLVNSIFLLMVYPFEVIIVIVSVIGFLFLQKWRNPAKIYYYFISFFNVLGFLFQDFTWTFVALLGIISSNWINNLYVPNIMKPLFNSNEVICRLFFYFRDIGPLLQYWTTALFAIHRMLVVLFPLKTNIIQKIFNKFSLILILLLVGCFYIPDFFIVQLSQGKYCILMTLELGFWRVYYGQLIYLNNILPLIIICISLTVISYGMWKAAIRRSQFSCHTTFHRHASLEWRSTLISMAISVVYVICELPYGLSAIVLSFLNSYDCLASTYSLAMVFVDLNSILYFEQMLLRATDGIVFFLMIPDFRRCILNTVRCRFPTYALAAPH